MLIIDDGSTDKTAEICATYSDKDERIRYISSANSGVSAARNKGIAHARGNLLAFLDSDDLWTSNKLEIQLYSLRNDPDAVVLSGLHRFSDDGSSRTFMSITSPPVFRDRADYIKTLLNLNNNEMACFGTALLKKKHLLDTVGLFDENLVTAEDWDLWLRLAIYYPFVNIDQPLRLYRKYPGSLTTQVKLGKTLHGQLYIIDKIAGCNVLSPSDFRLAKMRKYLEFAGIYRYKKMRFAELLLTAKAIISCPSGYAEQLRKKASGKIISRLLKNS